MARVTKSPPPFLRFGSGAFDEDGNEKRFKNAEAS